MQREVKESLLELKSESEAQLSQTAPRAIDLKSFQTIDIRVNGRNLQNNIIERINEKTQEKSKEIGQMLKKIELTQSQLESKIDAKIRVENQKL